MVQTKSNLPKKQLPVKQKNKRVNKLELTVRLHENPIKTKIKALVAGRVEVNACSAKCQWEGLNYSTLSIYNPPIVSEFLKGVRYDLCYQLPVGFSNEKSEYNNLVKKY